MGGEFRKISLTFMIFSTTPNSRYLTFAIAPFYIHHGEFTWWKGCLVLPLRYRPAEKSVLEILTRND